VKARGVVVIACGGGGIDMAILKGFREQLKMGDGRKANL
jgi:hypothetical protein